MTELSDRDRAILAFETRWAGRTGSKEDAILSEFHVSPTRYYQLLNALLERPEALFADPILVKRLLRQRDRRTVQRTARRP